MKQTDKIISSIRKSCTQTSLGIGMPRFHRRDRLVTNEINNQKNATSDAGNYTKNLIHTRSGPYCVLSDIVAETRKFHEDMTSPTKIRGVRLLASKNYMDYVEGVRSRKDKFNTAKREFMENYQKYIEDSRTRLGDMFDYGDYPQPSTIEERFYFDSTCQPLPDSDNVEVFVSGEELHKMKNQLETDMMENVNKNQRALWEQMYHTINRMAEKCSKEIGSKGAVFVEKGGKGMVTDLVKLCGLIPKKDILGDADLELIRKEVEEKLLVSPESLRTDPVKRDEIASSASQILSSMAGYMGYTPQSAKEKKIKAEVEHQQWVESSSTIITTPPDIDPPVVEATDEDVTQLDELDVADPAKPSIAERLAKYM